MSYPIDIDSPEIAVLEAILHEYNHNKINLIMQTEKLILSDMREQYYSPYRPDPRQTGGQRRDLQEAVRETGGREAGRG